ncbi:MAG: hypothetical protein HY905_06655 [Deltaproteobacteria bacterium]|nr:hypothetical protein [Deltaproteobacteria bacterium]
MSVMGGVRQRIAGRGARWLGTAALAALAGAPVLGCATAEVSYWGEDPGGDGGDAGDRGGDSARDDADGSDSVEATDRGGLDGMDGGMDRGESDGMDGGMDRGGMDGMDRGGTDGMDGGMDGADGDDGTGTTGVALTAFETDDFSGSGVCASCHGGLADGAGRDVSIDKDWRATSMANAAKDPIWQAKVASETRRAPALAAGIAETCARCHTGMARSQALADGSDVELLEPGFFDPAHPLHEAAMDGVSCALCHQIRPDGLGTAAAETGRYVIDTTTTPPSRPAFGPYTDPWTGSMRMGMAPESGFTPTHGSQIADSALCGSCHTVRTPVVDGGGSVVGEFPEQATYLEWRHADAGLPVADRRTCSACHLPADESPAAIASRGGRWVAARSGFAEHHLVGGNTFLLELLRTHGDELGVTADGSHFATAIARTGEQLAGETATVSIPAAGIDARGLVTAAIRVENRTGHKFPTGVPARRAWLHVTIRNAAGAVLFESGAPRDDGTIEGEAADADAARFEPHHDAITAEDQVQVYESVMVDTDGDVTRTWLRGASYVKDNRLLPAGFEPDTAEPDVAVQGDASTDPDFAGGSDEVHYSVSLPGAAAPLTISAELLYQAFAWRYAEDLRDASGEPLIDRFGAFWDAADHTPTLVGAAETVLP